MDFGDIAGLLGSVFSGGLTGVIGAVVTGFFERSKRAQDLEAKRLDQQHDIALRNMDIQQTKAEAEGRFKVAKEEGDARKDVAESEAFAKSLTSEPKRFLDVPSENMPWLVRLLLGILDFFRGIIRPGLTVYLAVLTTVIYLQMRALMETYGASLKADQVAGIVMLCIQTFLYLFTTCFLWWFGTRNKQKPPGIA